MIAQNQVNEVKRLLATGKYSQRKIAELTKISRGTISTIASGKRRDRIPKKKAKETGPFEGPIKRCPECGKRVHMPCRFCQTRRFVSEGITADLFTGIDPYTLKNISLGIELKGESLRRYEKIHQKRLLKDEANREYEQREAEEEDFFPEMYFTTLLSKGKIIQNSILI